MSKYEKLIDTGSNYQSPLVEGESVLWSTQPKKSAFIVNKILTMMPFALLWLAFDSFFIVSIIASGELKQIWFFVIPFFAIHMIPVWIWLANILTANRTWKNTKYYVTDKRIICQSGFVDTNCQTIYYKDIKNVSLHIGIIDKLSGVGDIYFQSANNNSMLGAFLDIENPHKIYSTLQKVVLDIQTDIEFPNALRPNENPGYNTKYKL